MKLNLDFYQDKYVSDEKIDKILDLISNVKTVEYEFELLDNDIPTWIFNEISSSKQNNICWYKFKNTESVLEIGTNYGVISNFLCDKFDRVVSIDWYKKRAEKISDILQDRKNLELVIGDTNQICLDEKFDYIVLFSDYNDYQKLGFKDINELLSYAKNHLKENGTILFATDNKFGVKNFVGAVEISGNNIGSSIQKSISKSNPLPSKKMIDDVINGLGFVEKRYFYPLPDYHLPAVIFTDEYLPKKDDSKLMYPLNYLEGSFVIMNENKILKQLSNENKFDFFANSYLIELSNSKYNNINDEVIYISFNNSRKEQYRTITKIKKDIVEKEGRNKCSNNHISNIGKNIENLNNLGFSILDYYNKDKNTIISKFCKHEQLSSFIIELLRKGNNEEALNLVKKYYEFIKEKLKKNTDTKDIKTNNILTALDIELNSKQLEMFYSMFITKNGYTDLVFENIFFNQEKNGYLFFDQEWYFKNTPVEYILYRALNNIYIYGDLEKYYSFEDMLDEMGISKYKEIFEVIEKKFQEYVISKERVKQLVKCNKRIEQINVIKQKLEESNEKFINKEKELHDTLECVNILKNEKAELEKKLIEKEQELNAIYSSKIWNAIQNAKKIMKGKKD